MANNKWNAEPIESAAPVDAVVEEAAPVESAAPVVEAEPVAEPVAEVAPAVVEKVEKTVLSKAIKSAKDDLKGEERVRVRWSHGSSLGLSDGEFVRFVDGVATIKAKHLEEAKKFGVEPF